VQEQGAIDEVTYENDFDATLPGNDVIPFESDNYDEGKEGGGNSSQDHEVDYVSNQEFEEAANEDGADNAYIQREDYIGNVDNMKSSLIRIDSKLEPKKLKGISTTHSLLPRPASAPAITNKVKQKTQPQQLKSNAVYSSRQRQADVNNEIKDQIARLQMLIAPFHLSSKVKSDNVFVGCPTAALHDDIKAITLRLESMQWKANQAIELVRDADNLWRSKLYKTLEATLRDLQYKHKIEVKIIAFSNFLLYLKCYRSQGFISNMKRSTSRLLYTPCCQASRVP
jgi:hypothetical protein